MTCVLQDKKGLNKYLIDTDLDPQRFSLHISELTAGASAHPPHTHAGTEAFYILAGQGTIEVADQAYLLNTNEAIVVEASKLHGIRNTGTTLLRYLVINVT